MFRRKQRDLAAEQKATLQQQQFRKLCQLCSPNFSKEDVLATEIDWPVVWKLALRHRVVPVMADRIKQLDIAVPTEYAELIAENVQQNLYKGMKQAAELVRLTKLFEAHDISFVVFKGIALLKLMGLELHQRHHGDIDILLADVEDVWRADEYLRNAGYERTHPPETLELNAKQLQTLLLLKKDLVYWHPKNQVQLEMHYRLCNNTYLFPIKKADYYKKHSVVKINGVGIPVMSREDYLLYSLVHGATSRWFRLKWLLDIIIISDNGKDYQKSSLMKQAQVLGIKRVLFQGLVLANELCAMPLPDHAKHYAVEDGEVNQLLNYAHVSLMSDEPGQVEKKVWYKKFWSSWLRITSYELRLRDDGAYKIQQLKGYFTVYRDWEDCPLPTWLFFMYFPLRPLLWLKRQF